MPTPTFVIPAPFSAMAHRIGAQTALNSLRLRPFGCCEADLAIDFAQESRPHLVTELLCGCTCAEHGQAPGEDFFWDLTIGKRLEALLTIATVGGAVGLSVPLRCKAATCQAAIAIELTLAELAELQQQADATPTVKAPIAAQTLHLRKPTGRDQLAWRKQSYADEHTAVSVMIDSLLLGQDGQVNQRQSEIPATWMEVIGALLAEADPLVNYAIAVACPVCDQVDRYPIDLDQLALAELQGTQNQLIESVHRLAQHYHWSESQILAIAPWRRARYLGLIEKEEKA